LPRVVITIAIAITKVVARAGLIPFLVAITTIPLARIVIAIARIVAPTGIVKHAHPP
jgi:hypothetical protein